MFLKNMAYKNANITRAVTIQWRLYNPAFIAGLSINNEPISWLKIKR